MVTGWFAPRYTNKKFSYMVYLYIILIVLWITAEEPQQGLRERQIRVIEKVKFCLTKQPASQ